MKPFKSIITYFLFFIIHSSYAQDWTLKLSSNVEIRSWKLTSTYEKEERSLQGASIVLTSGSQIVTQTTSDGNGDFTIMVPPNGEFVLTVSYPGYNTKRFAVNTQNVPNDIAKENFKPSFSIGGFIMAKPFQGIDYSGLNQTLVRVEYNAKKKKFTDNEEATVRGIQIVSKIAADENALIQSFCSTNKSGDVALAKPDCPLAKTLYQKAMTIIPFEAYPVEQLKKVSECLKDKEENAKKAEEEKKAAEAAAKAKAEEAKLAAEKAAANKANADKQAAEKAAADKIAAQNAANEKAAAEKAARDKAAAEKAEKQKEGLAKSKAEDDAAIKASEEKRQAKIAADKEAAAKAKEDELAAKKAADEKRKEKEQKQKEGLAKAKAEDEAEAKAIEEKRLAKEQERKEKEAKEKEAMAKAKAEDEAEARAAEEKKKAERDAKAAEDKAKEVERAQGTGKFSVPQTVFGQDNYKVAIKKADDYFKMKRWSEAKPAYEEALKYKANDPYATSKLEIVNKNLNATK
jgi:hypothetical protein